VSKAALSCCIVAMDEADRIEHCLASVAFCDEIVLVDSHSRDQTRELARARGAQVIERDWPGHVAQKEFAVRAAAHDWVLCVDADERVSDELRAEIEALRERGFPAHAGWRFPRLVNYLGTWVRHGTWYPDLQLRLFDRRRARWGGHDPHDRVELQAGTTSGELRGDLFHYPYRSFADHLATIDQYTTLMARGMLARGRHAGFTDLFLRPWVRFARFYLLKRGFLLGWKGLVLALLAAHYVRLKYMKLLVLERGEALE
jgi:glycosyltransferase involved in cell wall biosynthesis